jgi:hypothetical protein
MKATRIIKVDIAVEQLGRHGSPLETEVVNL